jgi:hypothetical protein
MSLVNIGILTKVKAFKAGTLINKTITLINSTRHFTLPIPTLINNTNRTILFIMRHVNKAMRLSIAAESRLTDRGTGS